MSQSHPSLLFGSGVTGTETSEFHTTKDIECLLDELQRLGITRLDTTPRHPPGHNFLAETLYGQAGAASKGFIIDGKNNLDVRDLSGSLAPDSVRASLSDSLDRMHLDKFGIFYAYAPDPTTPLYDQVSVMDELYRKGLFEQLGLSNFPPELLEKWIEICEENGFVKPTVYQGQYNLLCRGVETSLFPILRKNNMKFVAYCPLAGGFLSGKLSSGQTKGTRFDGNNPAGIAWANVYDKPQFHEIVRVLSETIQPHGITLPETALRWLCFHSALTHEDGIILGASKIWQLGRNVADIKKGSLPPDVVKRVEDVWQIVLDHQ